MCHRFGGWIIKVKKSTYYDTVCWFQSYAPGELLTTRDLDIQLDAATTRFCALEVAVYKVWREIKVSPIFQWYCLDFGENEVEAVRWISSIFISHWAIACHGRLWNGSCICARTCVSPLVCHAVFSKSIVVIDFFFKGDSQWIFMPSNNFLVLFILS